VTSVRRVGPEAADEVLAVVREAFGSRPQLDPPADALSDTPDSIAAALAHGGGLIVEVDGHAAGALLLDPQGDTTFLRRVGVLHEHRHSGVASTLVRAALEAAAGAGRVVVLAREELPATVEFWVHQGFTEVARDAPYVRLERAGVLAYDVPDAEAMRDLGRDLATRLRAGDLVVLTGGLGAGKTTLSQGIGAGLRVRGDITSPTFVIARVHPSLVDGPSLVHVDAYRLGGIDELDDLDLEASLEDAVTLVEWGAGLAEGLAQSRLEVRIARAEGAETTEHLDPRRVYVGGVGARWLTAGSDG
jgi:tRNA threonylcarbamoyladenosine biosynthesis protein TsaE